MRQSVRFSLSLSGAAALALAGVPYSVSADTGEVDGLEPISISLDDVVKFDWNIQGATQGAGTPNQAGVDFFIPLSIGEQNVWFLDTQFNANFGDVDGSSIVNTDVAGTTLSTSTRLGYRWLNDNRSWMYGVNAGYDTRNMNTGEADNTNVSDKRDVTFEQVAFGLEAANNDWGLNAYALVPTGDKEKRLNGTYVGGALDVYGLDVSFDLTSELTSSVSYYYQQGDFDEANGSGIKGRMAYALDNGLKVGVNLSHDHAFSTRLSGDFKYIFGNKNTQKKEWETPVIQALTESVKHRDIKIHDKKKWKATQCGIGHNGWYRLTKKNKTGAICAQYVTDNNKVVINNEMKKYNEKFCGRATCRAEWRGNNTYKTLSNYHWPK